MGEKQEDREFLAGLDEQLINGTLWDDLEGDDMSVNDYMRGENDAEYGEWQGGQSEEYNNGYAARYEFIERMTALTEEIEDYENA